MKGLTPLQTEVLQRFFARRDEFFLTGGAALVGFYTGHRETHDLDLFTAGQPLDEGERTLREVASALDLSFESIRREPAFRRFLVRQREGGESLVIDLVRDDAPQLREKRIVGNVRVDSAEEILANKFCALLSRVEVRDLVDVMVLQQSGLDPIAAVHAAAGKDAGVTPSQLAWVLSSFPIPEDRGLPGEVSPDTLRAFRDDLIRRLAAAAFPEPAP
ncbi:MAG TPA: nucleotidyl transferase AbiEii/AbiGii toxin family protein [Thermoanaerobaculia bacterium]